MGHINYAKTGALAVLGIAGSCLANVLGGWDTALQTLVLFMFVDYVTGLIVAGVFRRSTKTESGALDSRAGWKGLFRKGGTLLIVIVAAQIDLMTGSGWTRDAVVIAYIINEVISIVENVGLMGVPIPDPIRKGLDMLGGKAGSNEDTKD